MTFSINDFNSKINRYGLSKSNLFHVVVNTPPCLQSEFSSEFYGTGLQFFCRSAEVPDMAIETVPVYHQGTGLPVQRTNGMRMSNLNTVFMLDSEFRVKHFFHGWLQRMYNYSIDNIHGEVDGQLPYEIGYPDDYKTTVTVTQFSSNSTDNFYTYRYLNAFPTTIGSVSLSWETQNEIATLPVSFTFESVSPMGATPSNGISTRSSSITGILQDYLEAQKIVDNIREFDKIRDVQDAINRITTVSSALKRFF